MAGGTGVGGIKDSQGNFEIIGKDSGSVGTRGGTFVMPIGDVSAQTSGALSVNVFTARTLHNAQAINLSVVSFTPAAPPAAPTINGTFMAFTAGLDATGNYGVFHLGKPDAADVSGLNYGLFLDYLTISSSNYLCLGVEADVFLPNVYTAFPNTPNGFGESALEGIFVVKATTDDASVMSFTAPCDGYVTDIMALINAPLGDVTVELELVPGAPDLICILAASGVVLVRRATTIARSTAPDKPIVSFVKGESFLVNFPASSATTRSLVKISYVRTGSVL